MMKAVTNLTFAIAMTFALALPAFAGSIAHEDRMEMTAVTHAAITPTRAIQIAENGGGRAYNYGMESTAQGQNWYEVDVLRGGKKVNLRIDPTTGKVLDSRPATGEGLHGANALDGRKLTFANAIAHAERIGNGRALEADAAGQGNNAHVDVDVIQGADIAHYRVSMHDGQVQATKTGTSS